MAAPWFSNFSEGQEQTPAKKPQPKEILAIRHGKLRSRQMELTVKSPNPSGSRHSAGHSFFQRFSSTQSPLFPRKPLFPASDPATGSINGSHPKSKFLVFSLLFSHSKSFRTSWTRLVILIPAFTLLSSCFPPNQSGRPWYGESYAKTEAYQIEKAKNEQRARDGGIQAEKWAAARREYGKQDASPSGSTATPEVIARARDSERRSKEEMDRRAYEAELKARLPALNR
jgi:hypothetical protein